MSLDNVEIVRRAHELYRNDQFDVAIDRYFDAEVAWETRWPGLEPWFYGRDVLWLRDGLIYQRRTFYSEAEALEATGADGRASAATGR